MLRMASELKEATEPADNVAAEDQLFPTQNDGRNNDYDENLPTQTVAPREIQALLRYKPFQTTQAQREVRLQLPELDTEYFINLGRLISTEPNSAKNKQLVRLYDTSRPPDTQIISHEHSQLLIRQTAPGCFTVMMNDTKDHGFCRTVLTSPTGVRRVVTHDSLALLSHGYVIHLSPLAKWRRPLGVPSTPVHRAIIKGAPSSAGNFSRINESASGG
jgi:hypothetical protein